MTKYCGIVREITKYNEATKTVKQMPLNTIASSKLCRKSHMEIATKVRVTMYATGLHKAGSSAVEHYSKLEIWNLFMLMCVTFDQPHYTVDKDLNVIEVK